MSVFWTCPLPRVFVKQTTMEFSQCFQATLLIVLPWMPPRFRKTSARAHKWSWVIHQSPKLSTIYAQKHQIKISYASIKVDTRIWQLKLQQLNKVIRVIWWQDTNYRIVLIMMESLKLIVEITWWTRECPQPISERVQIKTTPMIIRTRIVPTIPPPREIHLAIVKIFIRYTVITLRVDCRQVR